MLTLRPFESGPDSGREKHLLKSILGIHNYIANGHTYMMSTVVWVRSIRSSPGRYRADIATGRRHVDDVGMISGSRDI